MRITKSCGVGVFFSFFSYGLIVSKVGLGESEFSFFRGVC